METSSPRLRRPRPGLTFLSLVLCLPWLALVLGGQCPFLANRPVAVAQTTSTPGCCPQCIPQVGAVHAPLSAPLSTQAGFCCETSKVCLPLNPELSKPDWQETRTPLHAGINISKLLAFLLTNARLSDDRLSMQSWSEPPPDTFLCTVARRCFPNHAPPVAAALLS